MDADPHHHKRWDDGEQTAKVAAMIEVENDPKQRALLMLIEGTRRALNDNTSVMQEMRVDFKTHRNEFETHKKEQDKLVNQGLGAKKMARAAWMVIAIVVGVTYSLLMFSGSRLVSKVDALDAKLNANIADHARYDTRLDALERQQQQGR